MRTLNTQEQAQVSGGFFNFSLGALKVQSYKTEDGYNVVKWNNLTESGKHYSNGKQSGGHHNSIFGRVATWFSW